MNISDSVIDLIGKTPLVWLNKVTPPGSRIAGKLEYFNPGSA